MSSIKVTEKTLEFRTPNCYTQNGDEEGMKCRWYDDVHEQMEMLFDKWLEEHPEFKDADFFPYNTRVVFDIGTNEEDKS